MKIRIRLFALLLMFSGLTMATHASAKNNAAISAMSSEEKVMRATEIKQRVDQIEAMDLSHLSTTERKDMRQELKGMKSELRQMGPTYIYISGAALVLIIILLIILL